MNKLITNIKKNQFLFQQLVHRDFTQKYKRSILGMGWSVLSPLLTLLIMKVIFTQFFAKDIDHYTIYLFSGNIILSYYKEATKNGMSSLVDNAKIFTKINVPKYMFTLSKNVSALVNFGLTLIVFFVFCILDDIHFWPGMFLLVYPIACLLIFNIGVGMILSALFVFFRDVRYLYDVFLTLITYMSAIFYSVDKYWFKNFFLLNPVYVYIKYFRTIVIDAKIPSLQYHGLCLLYAAVVILFGMRIYKKYNHQFLYYL
ncbi:MAG: ABC transporter permease [Lachnospiraceae bacterium]|jgi:ABC-2 type transport system permease protein|nr:ABC transporter permease [Lachnospiraceae bacterium]MCH4028073.1 ABC transporter permease [Lachnospiraceae bacterium]MCH4065917.1 ABC transporter permease [Lachnospiraceae bacterium]MCH4111953.1 ABC transporter permease [Lachnospiraceae bacterium]MCI1352248.1 ABC transporter permease [Lachnospiraceae bacterium]